MTRNYEQSYKVRHGVHLAIGDLVKAGMAGNTKAVERLANQLLNETPTGIRDEIGFRQAVSRALSTSRAPERNLLRSVASGSHRWLEPSVEARFLKFNGDFQARLEMFVSERKASDLLRSAGLEPSSKILIGGAPGVGKTMSAHWIADRLNLPLLTLNLSATLSSFLGESGRNIAASFQEAQATECVFLLDEFDALAKRRDDFGDVGELKRLVNVILLELDEWRGGSVLIAATNHVQLLDEAVNRRFDVSIEVPLPSAAESMAIVKGEFGNSLDPDLVRLTVAALKGASNSDLVRFCRSTHRSSLVEEKSIEDSLLVALTRHDRIDGATRDEVWLRLKDDSGLSSRRIAETSQLSHDAVNDGINRARGKLNGKSKQ